jgi:uncharacterized membrane protein
MPTYKSAQKHIAHRQGLEIHKLVIHLSCVSFSLSLSLARSLCLSLYLPLSLSLCLSLSVYFCLSLCLAFYPATFPTLAE